MKCKLQVAAVALVVFFSFSADLLAQTTAAEEMTLGVQAYKQSRFGEAIQHFEKCVALAPENTNAHLYLATAYAQQFIPGADSPENNRMAERAIDQYQHVLDGKPVPSARINSTKGIAYLYLQMNQLDDSKKYYLMALDLDPDDPENYYSISALDWAICYRPRQEERAKLGMQPDDSLPVANRKVCAAMKEKNSANVQEGIDDLKKALKIRPDYLDAMAYMNLMYRERADIQCDDPAALSADLKTADEWLERIMATKKAITEKNKPTTEPSATPQ